MRDASNKLYKRGSSDYPWCAGPRGHGRAQAHVVLFWWKEVDGRDPFPSPAVCPRLLCAGTPLGDCTMPPRSKSQYWNNHKDKHLPLKQARVLSPQALLSCLRGGGCLNLHPSRLSHLNQQEIRKFVRWEHSATFFSSYTCTHFILYIIHSAQCFLSLPRIERPCAVHTKWATKDCN